MGTNDEWEKFLSPEVTRDRLISASMYITAFEMLKASIVNRIRDFFLAGFDEDGLITCADYQTRVLSRHKSVLYASLNWLVESEVISDADCEALERLKAMRNKLAHELPSCVLGGADFQFASHFQEASDLLKKN